MDYSNSNSTNSTNNESVFKQLTENKYIDATQEFLNSNSTSSLFTASFIRIYYFTSFRNIFFRILIITIIYSKTY